MAPWATEDPVLPGGVPDFPDGPEPARNITRVYRDPLDEVWLAAAAALGLRIRRSADAYASYDGRGTLTLSTAEHFDADDSLAQMVLHELCHALVAGDDAFERVDWGLSNTDGRDLVLEHACHRTQAALADAHGLRDLFAVTTDHRPYWDALGDAPLGDASDPATPIAIAAVQRARQAPFHPALTDALQRTAVIARVVADVAAAPSLWASKRND